jgi:spore germination protein GerM
MTRHAAHGFFRLLPAPLVAGAALVLTAAVLIAACGGSTGGSQSATTPPPTQGAASTAPTAASSPAASASPSVAATTTLRLYFLRDDRLGVAQRQAPRTLAVARAAVTALLAGPTAAEQAAGLSTSIANGITLKSIVIRDGVAHVGLSAGPGAAQAGSRLATQPAPAQIVYTLTQFPGVKKVTISVGADSNAVSELNGGASSQLARSDFHLEPGIFVDSPGVGAVLPDPFTLRGSASVFEGSFTAQLVDSSGRRIARMQVQASAGAPERGTFARSIAYSTSAPRGWLVVYDASMKDGSRRDLVRIPVSFGG